MLLYANDMLQERTDYSALIEQLGGEVLDAAHFDTKCTHLIVGKADIWLLRNCTYRFDV